MTNNQTVPIRAAFYLRVSTEDQTEKYGLDLQQAAIEGIVKSKGTLDDGQPAMVLAGPQHIYKDEGVSGTIPIDERPAFIQMKEDIENAPGGAPPFDIVAVYRVDRFARKLKILLEVIDYFESKHIQFISANESIDTSTPFGKAMLGIIGVIAELEIETTKARTQAGKAQAREKGVYMGPSAPYGYKKNKQKQLEPLDEEAEIVKEIFDLFTIQKKKTQQIADYLTYKKVLSPLPSSIHYGKRKEGTTKYNNNNFWRDTTVRDILEDEIYIGKYYYNKYSKTSEKGRTSKEEWKTSPHRHVPIINIVQFELAQRRIQEETSLRNSKKTPDNHIYLLSGLLKCHACHDPYSEREPINWVGTNKKIDKKGEFKARYYQCGGKNTTKYSNPCKAIPFPAKDIEDFVTDFVKDLLNDPKVVYEHINSLKSTQAKKAFLVKQRNAFIKLLNGLPSNRQRIQDQHELGLITTEVLKEKLTNIDNLQNKFSSDLTNIEYRLGEGEISDIYVKTLKEFSKRYKHFLEGKLTERQEIFDLIHLLVDRIHVYSRKVNSTDKIAGRKKPDQMIPNKIRIDLRLPQDMLVRFAREGKFEVKNAEL